MKKRQYAPQFASDTSVMSVSNLIQTRPFQAGIDSNQQTLQVQKESEALTGVGFDLTKMQYALNPPATALGQPLQAKLTIGQPNDKYEQEADRVAHDVVQQINSAQTAETSPQTLAQRQEETIQMKPLLQKKKVLAGGEASPDLEASINQAQGSGQPLDTNLQGQMGQAMGANFGGVKVHADSHADQLNRSIQAKAFTTGQDVFFKRRAYQSNKKSEQKPINHKLIYVAQKADPGNKHEHGFRPIIPININQSSSPLIQPKRYEPGELINFRTSSSQGSIEQKTYNGFVVKIRTDNKSDDQIVYEVDAHIDGINKSLLVQGGVVLQEEHAPQVQGINKEVNNIFDSKNKKMKAIIGLPITFVTDENKKSLTKFAQLSVGDILIGEGIVIKSSNQDQQNFARDVVRDLITISKTKSGKALLLSINQAATVKGKAIEGGTSILTQISQTSGASNVGNPEQQWQGKKVGKPKSPELAYQPGFNGVLVSDRMKQLEALMPNIPEWQQKEFLSAVTDPLTSEWGRAKHKPSDVTLFHELIHAEDMMYGRLHKDKAKRGEQNKEIEVAEMRAVGLDEYYDEDFIAGKSEYPVLYSENTYRHERGVALREFYSDPIEGALAQIKNISIKELQNIPDEIPVPSPYSGGKWLKHKLTPNDNKIKDRKREIADALFHNKSRQKIEQGNQKIEEENLKASARNRLLKHVRKTGQLASHLAESSGKQQAHIIGDAKQKGTNEKTKKKAASKNKKKNMPNITLNSDDRAYPNAYEKLKDLRDKKQGNAVVPITVGDQMNSGLEVIKNNKESGSKTMLTSSYLMNEGYGEVKKNLGDWLHMNRFRVVKNNGGGRNSCLIISLIQHATGSYGSPDMKIVQEFKSVLQKHGINEDDPLDSSDKAFLELLRAVNEKYGKDIRVVYLLGDANFNPPYQLLDTGVGQEVVVVWDKLGHFEPVTL